MSGSPRSGCRDARPASSAGTAWCSPTITACSTASRTCRRQGGGRKVGPFTAFSGLFERATGADPFKLAPLWAAAQGRLSPGTIFNVATSNDTIGGNSGSPVIDRDGRFVGALFDGNQYGFGGFHRFDPALNRSMVIAATAIEEGLAKVYGMQRIVDELKEP